MATTIRFLAAFLCLAVAALLPVLRCTPATAATFTVNSSADVNDLTPGNGLCVAYIIIFPPFVLPFCTLRAAIEEANALPGADRINLPAGTFLLGLAGSNEDGAASGDLDITDPLILSGNGADETVVDAGGLDRILDLFGQQTRVTISGMTLQNGLLLPGLSEKDAGGAGIRNDADLTLLGVRLLGNQVKGSTPTDEGGGLLNTASSMLGQTSVSANSAARGGGIANRSGGSLEIQASTVAGNLAGTGAGLANAGEVVMINATISGNRSEANGGGILNSGEMSIMQCTVASNQAAGKGGGIQSQGKISLANTILAGNIGGNCSLAQAFTSLGHNLDSGRTCNLDAAGDLRDTDPKFGRLAPHGGPTDTHNLLIGSPAVDKGKDLSTSGITTDQRGVSRPQGSAFDIGAFETGPRSVVPLFSDLLF